VLLDTPTVSPLHGIERKRARPAPSVADWTPLSAAAAVATGVALGLGAGAAVVALDDGRAVTAASGLLTDLVLLTMVVAVAARGAERLGAATVGLRRAAFWPALGWSVALLLGIWLLEGVLGALLGGGGGGTGRHAPGRFATPVAVLLVAAVAISAPIVEEIAFRGYLFPAIAGRRGPWVGALVTAVLFGAAHVLALPPAFLPGIAVFGFGACLLRWFTGSLLPGIAVHAFNNAIVLAALSEGQLWWAIPVAPLACLALVAPFSAVRAEDVEDAVAAQS
jgi:membrane protease YdiL (CAAX protease family)